MGFEKIENSETIYYKLDELEKNTILKAVYNGSVIGGEFDTETHYFIDSTGQKYGLNGCAELNRKLSLVETGTAVAITYKGRRLLETKHGKVKPHSFWIEQEIDGKMEPVIYRSNGSDGEESADFSGSEGEAVAVQG